MSIPADKIVSVTPSVLSAGGNPLSLNGLLLTEASALPSGSPLSFSSAADVASYFGADSDEAEMAATYFSGFTTSTKKPSALIFYRYAGSAIPAFMRAGALAYTLTQLQGYTSGSLYINTDGAVASITSISLASASSFSDVATAQNSVIRTGW